MESFLTLPRMTSAIQFALKQQLAFHNSELKQTCRFSWWRNSFIFKKPLLNLLQYYFCFMFLFFGHKVCGILVPWMGIEPASSAQEGKVLTTWPQSSVSNLFPLRKSLSHQQLVSGLRVKVLVLQSCPTLCYPLDCSLPGPSIRGILQAKNTGMGS